MKASLSIAAVAASLLAVHLAAFSAFAEVVSPTSEARAAQNALLSGFQNPPISARPRVWWHWLNGNVSREGIHKDLEWMKRVGIGGLQNFDVNFAVPTIVEHTIPYMSPEWKDLYREAVTAAAEFDLEFGIAASPGWSETGGPWVPPEDGMKKLVWSEMAVTGGMPFSGVLPSPPSTTGPYMDMAPPKELNPTPKPELPDLYGDIAVLAYRVEDVPPDIAPTISLADDARLDAAVLVDGRYSDGVDVPRSTGEAPTIFNISYAQPQTIRSATLFIPGTADIYTGASLGAKLQAKTDGGWHDVSDIVLSTVPTTVGFPAVTAREFRVSVSPGAQHRSNIKGAAPGFDSGYTAAMAAMFGAANTVSVNELRLSPQARINQFEVKAGFAVAPDYYGLDPDVAGDENVVEPAAVIDLTAQMQPDGSLEWTPPPGQWQVLRLGYSLLGKTNHPATKEATGLEVDKLDAAAVRAYITAYVQTYRDAVGSDLVGARGINALLTDSTEVGAFNWTPGMLQQFRELRGYDALPWLPALTGVIVESREQSDKFLYDYRRTIAELHARAHYGTLASVAHENGLKVYGESLEGWRPSLGDDMAMRSYADYPMAALWWFPREDGPNPLYLADMRGAASTAHLYGRAMAAAESMTSSRYPWDHVPADLKRVVDLEFAQGINRVVIHSSVHQPLDDKQPGLSLRHIGQFFNRHTAWAEMAGPWMDYIARSSYLLQQGRFVADVAYFYGEEAPLGPQAWDGFFPDVPVRYGYDFVDPAAVLELFAVDDGDLVTPGGARYRLLYLGGTSERMTLPMLRRLAQLAEAGATIVGNAPVGSPALGDDASEYARLVGKLWSGEAQTPVGRGRVIAGRDVEVAMAALGSTPDVEFNTPQSDSEILFVHRQLDNGDIYYVSNRQNRAEQLEARFRVAGKAPQIWRADTVSVTPVSYRIEGDQTLVPLTLQPDDALFVVFVEPADEPARTIPEPAIAPVAEIPGPWTVAFQAGRGAPSAIRLAALAPLNEQADPGVRYFSGVASYTNTFSTPPGYRAGEALSLDLGQVGDLAEVWVNGRKAGSAWHAPFVVDIGPELRDGENALEIRVANRWVNRLIGDAQPGAKKVGYTVMPTYKADAPLRPSGLIGPVRLMSAGQ